MSKMPLFVLILMVFSSLLFANTDPVHTIKKNDAELQKLLKKSSLTKAEKDRIKNLLNDSFDFKLLAQKSLAPAVWSAQSEADQSMFIKEFQRMVRNSSARKLEMYKADSTIYDKPKLRGNEEARVTAHLWYKGKETILEYRMTMVENSWKAWDLIIDDLSTARNYKEQFSTLLKKKSFSELIQVIRDKANETE